MTWKDLSLDDCKRFIKEHKSLNRKQIYSHYGIYAKAMKHLGCFDELCPAITPKSDSITYDDCVHLKKEYPELRRKELRKYYFSYLTAMIKLGCLDELFPPRKVLKYSDEYLIERASKYKHVKDLNANEPKILHAIYDHGIEKKALQHMMPLGNRKWKMIYSYEFPDNTVYVGLTYDRERRKKDHRTEKGSAVYKHIKKTGLEPKYCELTELLPVDEAQMMEGEYVERYRQQGWKILNVVATGGIGSSTPTVDRDKVIMLFKQGIPPKAICEQMNIGNSVLYRILRQAGLSHRGISAVPVEVVDDEGMVLKTFPSIKDAAEYYDMNRLNLQKNIKNHWRVRGHYMRRNAYAYKIKHGKLPPEIVAYWQ